jgi:hypothetical protein
MGILQIVYLTLGEAHGAEQTEKSSQDCWAALRSPQS